MPGPALAIKPNYDFIQAKFLIIRTESSHVIWNKVLLMQNTLFNKVP